jgi:putative phosphoribosyl transferase
MMAVLFKDREAAAQRLVPRVKAALHGETRPVIIALPRGGVPLGAVIAKALDAPLDVVMLRKIGLPGQPELAVAAVTDGARPMLQINHDVAGAAGLSRADVAELAGPALAEIARRRALWFAGRQAIRLDGRTVVVVDDGIATGASMRAALAALRAQGAARLVVAVPLAPQSALHGLASLADQVICLERPSPFRAVGAHYADFPQVSDAAVTAALAPPDQGQGQGQAQGPTPPLARS